MSTPEGWLLVGRVGRPHGLDGSVHVAAPLPALLRLGAEVSVGGEAREIVRLAGTEQRPIVRLAGCEDRAAAEALGGVELLVPRALAPALGEDEWWVEELVGCDVHDGTVVVGVVRGLLGLPSCEALEVERAGGGEPLLVPLVRDAVRGVDIAGRRIDVDLVFMGAA